MSLVIVGVQSDGLQNDFGGVLSKMCIWATQKDLNLLHYRQHIKGHAHFPPHNIVVALGEDKGCEQGCSLEKKEK